MKKVYVVTDGCYSDYHIEGIFSSEQKALDFVGVHTKKALKETDVSIEEWILDEEKQQKYMTYVCMDAQGNVDFTYGDLYSMDRETKDYPMNGRRYNNQDKTYWTFYVETTDKNKAIKVANERRVALIAANQWDQLGPLDDEEVF